MNEFLNEALAAVPGDKRGNCDAAVRAALAGWADVESTPTRGGEGA